VFLGEAYLFANRVVEAWAIAVEACATGRAIAYPIGVGQSLWLLGLISLRRREISEAATYLNEALEISMRISYRPGIARSHLYLARCAAGMGSREEAAAHLRESANLFAELKAPGFVRRAEQLATELGLSGDGV